MATNPNFGFGFGGYGQGTFGNQSIAFMPIPYYLQLITSEYQSAPNFMAYAAALLKYLDDLSQLLLQMQIAFDLDQAVGVQLDVLGTIIGQSRRFSPRTASRRRSMTRRTGCCSGHALCRTSGTA